MSWPTLDHPYMANCVDFMREMESTSVDHVITDPPYSANTHKKQRRGQTPNYTEPTRPNAVRAQFNRARVLGFEPLTPALMHASAEQFARIARRWVLVFSDHENSMKWAEALTCAGLEYVRAAIWIKRGATPQFTGDRPAQGHEVIVIAHQTKDNGKPMKKKWNGGGKHGVYTYPIVLNRGKKRVRLHTAQKPYALMEQLVLDFTSEGEVVLDPFCGSGTTLLAAARNHRHFIGVDENPDDIMVAAERVQNLRDAEVEPYLLNGKGEHEVA